MKNQLIVIAGPTACGKTKTSIALAKKLNGEIISADSMQVYKYMDIGTAKPTLEEMESVEHYLIDELYPDDAFSVAIFQQMAKQKLNTIYSKHKIPIITGGTGFYINAIVNGTDFTQTEADTAFRNSLYKLAQVYGNEHVHQMLKEVDPESAKLIHVNNVKKIVRALEYYNQTKTPISTHNKTEKSKTSPFDTTFVVLTMDRKALYQRIEQRIDEMIQRGLIDEVKKLLEMGYDTDLISMQAIGYKEIALYLKGNISLEEAIEMVKVNTRHYAKRQLTWFKTQTQGLWVNVDELDFDFNVIASKIIDYTDIDICKIQG